MQPLIAAATVEPPWTSDCFYKSSCKHQGSDVEFLSILMHLLGQKISYYRLPDKTTTEEILQMLIEERLNITADTKVVSRYTAWNLSYFFLPNDVDTPIFVTKLQRVDANSSRFLLFEAMSMNVWLMIFFLTLISFPKLQKLFKFSNKTCHHYLNLHRFVKLKWFVWLNVILNVYGNILTVKMAIHRYKIVLPFENVTDLAAKVGAGECQLVTRYEYINEYMQEFILQPLNQSSKY